MQDPLANPYSGESRGASPSHAAVTCFVAASWLGPLVVCMSHCLPDGYNILSASAGAGILLGYLSRHHEPELEDGEAPAGQSAAESELAYQKAAFAELAAQNSRMLATASLSLPELAAGEAPKVGLRRQAETFDVEGEAPKMIEASPPEVLGEEVLGEVHLGAMAQRDAALEGGWVGSSVPPELVRAGTPEHPRYAEPEEFAQPPAVATWYHHHGTAAADAESEVRRAHELKEAADDAAGAGDDAADESGGVQQLDDEALGDEV